MEAFSNVSEMTASEQRKTATARSSLPSEFSPIVINEAQLVLAEKRTSLAVMRTGITVFVIPLSVLGVLVATSRYYDILHVLPLFIPLLVLCVGLLALGSFLIMRSLLRLRHHDKIINGLKKKYSQLAEFID